MDSRNALRTKPSSSASDFIGETSRDFAMANERLGECGGKERNCHAKVPLALQGKRLIWADPSIDPGFNGAG
jgi:hypothetical protein